MYEHWYTTNTLGNLAVNKGKEMWKIIQSSHKKGVGDRQLYSYEAMTVDFSTQLSSKEEEIRVLKENY